MEKEIKFNNEARDLVIAGINEVYKSVKHTIGPKGKNVLIERRKEGPLITNDGVTISQEIGFEDPYKNMGAELIREVATKTQDQAGDGTTTTILLTGKLINMINEIYKTTPDLNIVDVNLGMKKALQEVVKHINDIKRDITIDECVDVATVSSGDREIGELIQQAISKVGKHGIITVEDSKDMETSIEIVEGMELDRGYISPYMVDRGSDKIEMENPYILITDYDIENINPLIPLMNRLVQEKRPVLLITGNLKGDALTTMGVNNMRGILKNAAILAPEFGYNQKMILQDIATLTGGTVISKDGGKILDNVDLSDLGEADKIIVTKDKTTIVGGRGSNLKINDRIALIKNQLEETDREEEKEILHQRISKLQDGVGIIKVGAITETELLEKKSRIEDSLAATKQALDNGIVPGGGISLLSASKHLNKFSDIYYISDSEAIGFELIKQVLNFPFYQISVNSGKNEEDLLDNIYENLEQGSTSYGYDFAKNIYGDMFDLGIIDPANVTLNAVTNAVSIASIIMTTEVAIVDVSEPQPEFIQPVMPPMQ